MGFGSGLTISNVSLMSDKNNKSSRMLLPEDFDKMCVIGRGAFAKVYQVRKVDSGEIFAMKSLRKDLIM